MTVKREVSGIPDRTINRASTQMPPHAAEKLTLRNASPVMGRRREARKKGPTSCVQSWSCAIDTALRSDHICAKDIRLKVSFQVQISRRRKFRSFLIF